MSGSAVAETPPGTGEPLPLPGPAGGAAPAGGDPSIVLSPFARFKDAALEARFCRASFAEEVKHAQKFFLFGALILPLAHLGFIDSVYSVIFDVFGAVSFCLAVLFYSKRFREYSDGNPRLGHRLSLAFVYALIPAASAFVSYALQHPDELGCSYGATLYTLFYSTMSALVYSVAPFFTWADSVLPIVVIVASRDFWILVEDTGRPDDESPALALSVYALMVFGLIMVRERHIKERRTFVLLDSLRANDIRVNFQKESLASALRGWTGSGRVAPAALPWKIDAASIDWSASVELGAGSFGRVYKANWHGTVVAIKEVKHISQRALKHFIDEIALLAELRHPNIVLFMGVAVEEGPRVLMVTEFLDRGSLGDLLYGHDSEFVVSEVFLFNIFAQTCRGLAYLHRRTPPVLHHDIKPENILLDNKGNAKLGDFGVSTTTQNRGAGTPLYAAPEVLNGEPYTTAADVYALGLVFWESWTKQRPFLDEDNSDSVLAVVVKVAKEGLKPKADKSMPIEMLRACDQCWSRDLNERPPIDKLVVLFEDLLGQPGSGVFEAPGSFRSQTGTFPKGKMGIMALNLMAVPRMWQQDSVKAYRTFKQFRDVVRRLLPEYPNSSEAANLDASHLLLVFPTVPTMLDYAVNLSKMLVAERFEGSDTLGCSLAYDELEIEFDGMTPFFVGPSIDLVKLGLSTTHAGQLKGTEAVVAHQHPHNLLDGSGVGWLPGFSGKKQAEIIRQSPFSGWLFDYGDLGELGELSSDSVSPFAVTLKATINHRPVCIKRLHRRAVHGETRLEFLSELGRLRKLAHAHIAKVIGGCLPPPHFCVLVEFVGPSLKQELVRLARPLTLSEATRVLRETASGMAYLASVGIVHRELHAGNVLVAGSGLPVGEIKVTDYGFGQLRLQTVTMTRNLSVLWKAPEILQGEAATEKSDVYSFGVLAGEVMGGRWEGVEGAGLARVAQMVIEDGRRPVVPWSDGSAIGALIRHCWSHEPSQRPAFAQVVEHLLGGLNEVTASIEIIPAYPG